MTLRYDRPIAAPPITPPVATAPVNGLPVISGVAGQVHVGPLPVDTAPPTRSKVMGALAALACAACCALPFLIAGGVLTGAGAALARNLLLGVAGVLVAAAAGAWWLKRRSDARKAAAAGQTGCASDNCAC